MVPPLLGIVRRVSAIGAVADRGRVDRAEGGMRISAPGGLTGTPF